MDEYETPIEQLRPDIKTNQDSSMNYNDMLQSIETQQQVHKNTEFPQHPIVQSRAPHNPHMNMNFVEHKKENIVSNDTQMTQIQKDIIYILVPSILLYSMPIQTHITRVLPSLFKDDKPTILGNIVNGLIIACVFVGLKNMKINFS